MTARCQGLARVVITHLRVLCTTSAALSLLSLFLLLSRVQSRVMDRPGVITLVSDVYIRILISPDMISRTVTSPTIEVNIIEEKQ